MNYTFEIIRKTRESLLKMVDGLSIEQLNKIPEGFNNNVIWNIGHLIAAQQGICYKRAGFPAVIDEAFFDTYKSGTKPESVIDEAGFEHIKQLLVSTIDQLEVDYKNNAFANYTAWTTRYDVEISTIDQAITFLLFHEGLHTGYIQALKRSLYR